VSGKLHAPAALPPGKSPRYPFYRRLGGPQSWSGRYGEVNIFFPYRDSNSPPPIVQPLASRYTDWAIPAPLVFVIRKHNLIISIYGNIIPYITSFVTRNLLFYCGSSCIWMLWKSVLWELLKLFHCCLKRIKGRERRFGKRCFSVPLSFRHRRKEVLLRYLCKMQVSVSRIRNLTWTYWT
jgi:hypothetical protein